MSTNPASLEKWAKVRPDFVKALQEFAGLLATTFESMHQNKVKEEVKVPEDLPKHEQKLIERVLNDPEIQVCLDFLEIQCYVVGDIKEFKDSRVVGEDSERSTEYPTVPLHLFFLSV